MAKNWYCLQVASNGEKSFKERLEKRLEDLDDELSGKFGEVFVPAEEVVEMKKGKRKVSQRKFFPSYVFIEMEMDPHTWHVIKALPKSKGFVGDANTNSENWQEPQPVSKAELERIRSRVQEGTDKPRPKVLFEIGESVRVKEGPFNNFSGNVIDVNYKSNRIVVSLMVFNRPTELNLNFEQVEKM